MMGVERKIDQLGRVVIPMEFRKELGITFDSRVVISLSNGGILIRPRNGTCLLCGEPVAQNAKIQLCEKCITKVKDV